MNILGIETSCDETAVAVVEDGSVVLSNVIASSRQSFEHLAGVIPEEAARRQIECMIPVLEEALRKATLGWSAIDAVAVTKGPGLLGSLLVGTTTARVLASTLGKPLIGVHHTFGHLTSTWLREAKKQDTLRPGSEQARYPSTALRAGKIQQSTFPILTLSASGGHTDLWYRESHTRGMLLGRTRDDAAGEAFDKGASLLALPYPGGPSIAKAAEGGDPKRYAFPLPLEHDGTFDFSFSGLKTSLKYLLRDFRLDPQSDPEMLRNIAASYQFAICRHLADKVNRSLRRHPETREVHLVGGVSANTHLRQWMTTICGIHDAKPLFRFPSSLAFCTDNAAMIAAAGFFLHQELGDRAFESFETSATLPLEETVLSGSSFIP
ncbi:tRNA (adenosine(37)-N6)-threonylcarbamoyltransferase complex transferase subunit TsaD [Candidatus Peregrinibacteria bacterium]|nr:tRNA (adenosine(37)-N6)-threonylcarbamoyltransferase complex transferase subunit TsaD [Candidatus Peregrinibacteria bacterium]MBI3816222.1 tRNA (adenosine(37)-N6)-threonylcarbamoyltransferase complex transferase subunit TsaD [Candidatus Peregrinibacteria bacterium]